MMNLEYFTTRLSKNAATIQSLVQEVADEQARWKPTPEEWSILEVINHLYDEEREDFRTRLDLLLHQPGQPWPGIDPEGWVVERSYNTRNLGASLNNFFQERQRSVSWLKVCLHRLGRPATNIRRQVRSRPATCWLPGWPTTFSTSVSWPNCTGSISLF